MAAQKVGNHTKPAFRVSGGGSLCYRPCYPTGVLGWPKSSSNFLLYDRRASSYLPLTSFKTILLDCIVTAVISACIKNNLSKLLNLCAAILILKVEENYATSSMYCALLFPER